jgi:hypothetical protein
MVTTVLLAEMSRPVCSKLAWYWSTYVALTVAFSTGAIKTPNRCVDRPDVLIHTYFFPEFIVTGLVQLKVWAVPFYQLKLGRLAIV